MKQIDKKQIIKKINAEKIERERFTFYLDKKIIAAFKNDCAARGVSQSQTVEQLIKTWVN